jgi:hypothetical protein
MTIVLVIMGIAATVVVPALVDFNRAPPHHTADGLMHTLQAARRLAIGNEVSVTVLIDPKSGAYRVDSIGLADGGPVTTGTLDLPSGETLITDLPRLRYQFLPSGAAIADTVRVRGTDSSLVVSVDPWTGVARAGSQ